MLFTFILRGDVLALHSCLFELGESVQGIRVMRSEDSSVGSYHILEYCYGL